MSNNITSLVKEHHAFYEVLPYYVVLDERHGSASATTRTVQAGFDVEIYGIRTEDSKVAMAPANVYAMVYAELQKLVEKVLQLIGDSCSLEVIPFPTTAVLDSQDHAKVEAMLRIRISPRRGLDRAGPSEQRGLEEVEKQLKDLGVTRR